MVDFVAAQEQRQPFPIGGFDYRAFSLLPPAEGRVLLPHQRRAYGGCGLLQFGDGFLGAAADRPHAVLPPAEMHVDMCRTADDRGARRIVVVGPRESGKSTWWTTALPLRDALTDPDCNYIVFARATGEMAAESAHELRQELEASAVLQQAYGTCRHPSDWGKTQFTIVKPGSEHLPIARRPVCVVRCIGPGKQAKGRKFQGHRPDRIFVDDPENYRSLASPAQREQFEQWFVGELTPSLSRRGRIVVVGNMPLVKGSGIVGRIMAGVGFRDPHDRSWYGPEDRKAAAEWGSWTRLRYQALIPDALGIMDPRLGFAVRSYWPHKIVVEALWQIREELYAQGNGHIWASEYMQDPADPALQVIVSAALDDQLCEPGDCPRNGREARVRYPGLRIALVMDPAYSDRHGADECAVAVVGVTRQGYMVLLDLPHRRGVFFAERRQLIFDLHQKWGLDAAGVEVVTDTTFYETLLEEQGERIANGENALFPILKLRGKAGYSKIERIRDLNWALLQRSLRTYKEHGEVRQILRDYRASPHAHDDVPDALQFAWRLAQRLRATTMPDMAGASRAPTAPGNDLWAELRDAEREIMGDMGNVVISV